MNLSVLIKELERQKAPYVSRCVILPNGNEGRLVKLVDPLNKKKPFLLLIVEQIAVGGYSRVYKAVRVSPEGDTIDTEIYAIKFGLDKIKVNPIEAMYLKIAKIKVVFSGEINLDENKKYSCIVQEYFPGVSLREYFASSLEEALQLTYNIITQIHHLHVRRIIHADVKNENIRCFDITKVWLIDFGLSQQVDFDFSTDNCIAFPRGSGLNPYYFAPEVFYRQRLGYKSDIYMLKPVICNLIGNVTSDLPVISAISLKQLVDNFLNRMSEQTYEKRPDIEQVIRFFAALRTVVELEKNAKDVSAQGESVEQNIALLVLLIFPFANKCKIEDFKEKLSRPDVAEAILETYKIPEINRYTESYCQKILRADVYTKAVVKIKALGFVNSIVFEFIFLSPENAVSFISRANADFTKAAKFLASKRLLKLDMFEKLLLSDVLQQVMLSFINEETSEVKFEQSLLSKLVSIIFSWRENVIQSSVVLRIFCKESSVSLPRVRGDGQTRKLLSAMVYLNNRNLLSDDKMRLILENTVISSAIMLLSDACSLTTDLLEKLLFKQSDYAVYCALNNSRTAQHVIFLLTNELSTYMICSQQQLEQFSIVNSIAKNHEVLQDLTENSLQLITLFGKDNYQRVVGYFESVCSSALLTRHLRFSRQNLFLF